MKFKVIICFVLITFLISITTRKAKIKQNRALANPTPANAPPSTRAAPSVPNPNAVQSPPPTRPPPIPAPTPPKFQPPKTKIPRKPAKKSRKFNIARIFIRIIIIKLGGNKMDVDSCLPKDILTNTGTYAPSAQASIEKMIPLLNTLSHEFGNGIDLGCKIFKDVVDFFKKKAGIPISRRLYIEKHPTAKNPFDQISAHTKVAQMYFKDLFECPLIKTLAQVLRCQSNLKTAKASFKKMASSLLSNMIKSREIGGFIKIFVSATCHWRRLKTAFSEIISGGKTKNIFSKWALYSQGLSDILKIIARSP